MDPELHWKRQQKKCKCPHPPPASFDDADWDHVDWANFDWDEFEGHMVTRDGALVSTSPGTPNSRDSDHVPFSTPPETPNSEHMASPPEPSEVVGKARVKLQQDFQHGIQRIPTPGTGQLCGLYAAQLSMGNQADFKNVRQPTIEELENIWAQFRRSSPNENANNSFFELYQLARIVQTYLERQNVAAQLGAVFPSSGVKVFPVVISDLDHLKGAEKVLWVYNNGARDGEDGTHWEGLRSEGLNSSVEMEAYWKDLMGSSNLGSPEAAEIESISPTTAGTSSSTSDRHRSPAPPTSNSGSTSIPTAMSPPSARSHLKHIVVMDPHSSRPGITGLDGATDLGLDISTATLKTVTTPHQGFQDRGDLHERVSSRCISRLNSNEEGASIDMICSAGLDSKLSWKVCLLPRCE